jgi:D-alanyl-D-alanine carboxypeptidase
MHRKLALIIALAIIVGGYLVFFRRDSHVAAPTGNAGKPVAVDSSIQKYTIDNQNSLYYVVNKQRALPSSFVPENLVNIRGAQLRSDAANAMNQLFDAARTDGINFKIISAYRSYNYQVGVYGGYVKKDGVAKADTYSARPGHSEHQLGLAADLGTGTCDLQICFGDTAAGKWLLANSYKYGFIVRYQKGKENLTGYQYEPWHIRYLGIDLAAKVTKSGKTLEQYFDLPAATSY